jgi:hypothetical protein
MEFGQRSGERQEKLLQLRLGHRLVAVSAPASHALAQSLAAILKPARSNARDTAAN